MYIYEHTLSEPYQRTHDELGAIIGSDDRQRVRDSDKAPYRWICALDLLFPRMTMSPGGKLVPTPGNLPPRLDRGTGVLISPRHVLTAAHNVIPFPGVEALSITVTPGMDGTKILGKQQALVGSQRITRTAPGVSVKCVPPPARSPIPANWWVPPEYQPSLAPLATPSAWDFALLTLPKDFPPFHGMPYGYWTDLHYAPSTKIVAVTAEDLAGVSVSLCGYPGDRCKDRPCNPDPGKPGWASTQWETGGTVQPDPPPGFILYKADTSTGMSGAPVWQKKEVEMKRANLVRKKEILELVAIHTGRHTRPNPQTGQLETLNRGIPLVAQLLNLLRERMLCDREREKF